MSLKPGYFGTPAISEEKLLNQFLPMQLSLAANGKEAAQIMIYTENQAARDQLMDRLHEAFLGHQENGFQGAPVAYEILYSRGNLTPTVKGKLADGNYLVETQGKAHVMAWEDLVEYHDNTLHPENLLKDKLPDGGMGIVFYRYGMEPSEDLAFGEAQYLRFLDYLTADSAKKYPGWCVVGVMAQDDPNATQMNAILKPSSAITVN